MHVLGNRKLQYKYTATGIGYKSRYLAVENWEADPIGQQELCRDRRASKHKDIRSGVPYGIQMGLVSKWAHISTNSWN